jgi:hypothetical protein
MVVGGLLYIVTCRESAQAENARPDTLHSPVPSPLLVNTRQAKPLWSLEELAMRPFDAFKECDVCPEMVVVPAGTFVGGARMKRQR